MVYCIIDGDSIPFAPDLLDGGFAGGAEAARTLSDKIKACIDRMNCETTEKKQFWLSIFRSKSTLDAKYSDAAEKIEQFYQGLTQGSPRFLLVNSGPQRSQTVEKIKGKSIETC